MLKHFCARPSHHQLGLLGCTIFVILISVAISCLWCVTFLVCHSKWLAMLGFDKLSTAALKPFPLSLEGEKETKKR